MGESQSNNEGGRRRDLRSVLDAYGHKDESPDQKLRDAQLTQYEMGSGSGIEEIRQQVARDPSNEKYKDWLAFSLYTNNQLDEAITLYEQLIVEHPGNPTYHYYLANSYAKKGHIESALAEWKVVVRIDPYTKMGRKAQARAEHADALLSRASAAAIGKNSNPGIRRD